MICIFVGVAEYYFRDAAISLLSLFLSFSFSLSLLKFLHLISSISHTFDLPSFKRKNEASFFLLFPLIFHLLIISFTSPQPPELNENLWETLISRFFPLIL